MRKGRFYNLALVAVSALFISYFTACNSNPGSQTNVSLDTSDTVATEPADAYPIPPISDLTERLQKAGVGYMIGEGNDPDKAASYESTPARAINLGVYGADLSYASTYGAKDEVVKYLDVVVKLSRSLNLHSDGLEAILKLGDAGIENKDTVQLKAKQSIFETYAGLCTNGQREEAVMFLSGGWLEAVYIGSRIASLSQSKEQVVEMLLNQMKTYDTLVGLFDSQQRTEAGNKVYELLKTVFPAYQELKANPQDDSKLQNLVDALDNARTKLISVSAF